jgi:acyl dehydratase
MNDQPGPDQTALDQTTADQPMPDRAVPDQTAAQLVTRHEIRRFAFAVGATSPIHHDVAAARARGYPDLVAPAFFFTTLGLSLGRFLPPDQLREDGLARDDEVVGRVVAGDTTIEWSGAIVAGDEVRVIQRFLGRRSKVGRSGPFTIFDYARSYTVDGHQVVLEHLARIAR